MGKETLGVDMAFCVFTAGFRTAHRYRTFASFARSKYRQSCRRRAIGRCAAMPYRHPGSESCKANSYSSGGGYTDRIIGGLRIQFPRRPFQNAFIAGPNRRLHLENNNHVRTGGSLEVQ